ncbi:MAG TPA: flagellar motor switch protein FliM [Acidisarcina sp.]
MEDETPGNESAWAPAPAEGHARLKNVPGNVQPCNFRSAGRLSNENARILTMLHEQFARNVGNALDVVLGTALEMRLISLEQIEIENYMAKLQPTDHIVPCLLSPLQISFLMDMEIALMFPIIDLLLGGVGAPVEHAHELTEIDEEIMQSVTAIIAGELERSWQPLDLSLSPGHTIKHPLVLRIFPPNEKPLLLTFQVTVAGVAGRFRILLPTSFASILLRQIRTDPSKSNRRKVARLNLREWVMDCDVSTATVLPQARVPVSELIALAEGSILKLRAPVQNPARLSVEGREVFEALPVRSGLQRAAQLLSGLPEVK